MLDFSGDVVLVTGAGQGLGRAYALALAARGAHVIVNDVNDNARHVVAEIGAAGGRASLAPGSVVEEADAVVSHAVAAGGRLTIVINNAGITGGGPFHRIPATDWHRLLAVQLDGTVNICRAAWPHLVATGAGRVLNTSSAAIFGAPFTSHYAAAKGAIMALTRCWAGEGATGGVRVNCIMPSAFTPMTVQIPDPAFRRFLADHFQPDMVAEFVVWLVHGETRLNGETFAVGGGRAARVLLAEAHGVALPDARAERWAGREQQLLALDTMGYPASMLDEVSYQAHCLGGRVAERFAAIDRESNWADS